MSNNTKKIIHYVYQYDSICTRLAHISNDELIWSILINNNGKDDSQQCNYSPEWDVIIPESLPPSEPLSFEEYFPYSLTGHFPMSSQNSPPLQAQNSCFNFRFRKRF